MYELTLSLDDELETAASVFLVFLDFYITLII